MITRREFLLSSAALAASSVLPAMAGEETADIWEPAIFPARERPIRFEPTWPLTPDVVTFEMPQCGTAIWDCQITGRRTAIVHDGDKLTIYRDIG